METLPIPCEHDVYALMAGMPDVETVRALESMLVGYPQLSISPDHVIHGGMCARTILIPAGALLTGAETNCDNICIVCGDITATTDEGTRHLVGFNVFSAKAGSKRVVVANSDTWWTTIHCTELAEVADIENEMTDESDRLGSRRNLLKSEG